MKGINRREESFPLHSVYLHLHHQPHLSDIQTPQQLITISFHVNYTTFPPTLIQIINSNSNYSHNQLRSSYWKWYTMTKVNVVVGGGNTDTDRQ